MLKKWIAVGVFGILMAALAQPALAQQGSAGATHEGSEETKVQPSKGTKDLPGYVEFDHSKMTGALKPNVSVMLEGAMLKMAAAASAEANTPITALLEQLKLVQVKVFEGIQGGDWMSLSQFAIKKIAELKEGGWTPVVSVPEEEERVDVLVKSSDDSIQGLVVLVVEKDEVVLVNLAGDIDPTVMGGMLGKLGAGVFTGEFDFEHFLMGGRTELSGFGNVEEEVHEATHEESSASSEPEEAENR